MSSKNFLWQWLIRNSELVKRQRINVSGVLRHTWHICIVTHTSLRKRKHKNWRCQRLGRTREDQQLLVMMGLFWSWWDSSTHEHTAAVGHKDLHNTKPSHHGMGRDSGDPNHEKLLAVDGIWGMENQLPLRNCHWCVNHAPGDGPMPLSGCTTQGRLVCYSFKSGEEGASTWEGKGE